MAPPTPSPSWEPSEVDANPSILERVADVLGTPVPLLWVADGFPLWLLLLLLLLVITVMAIVWRALRRNRAY